MLGDNYFKGSQKLWDNLIHLQIGDVFPNACTTSAPELSVLHLSTLAISRLEGEFRGNKLQEKPYPSSFSLPRLLPPIFRASTVRHHRQRHPYPSEQPKD